MAKAKAKKAKVKKAKSMGARFEKRTTKFYADAAKGKIESAGLLIRVRLVQGKLMPDQIVAEVKKRFKGSTCKKSDVYWNRGRLKAEGITLPKAKSAAKAKK